MLTIGCLLKEIDNICLIIKTFLGEFRRDNIVERNCNTDAFFALLRAGLWEKEVCLSQYGSIDYHVIYRIAEEQSVVGLIAAGVEHLSDVKVLQEVVLQLVGQTLQLEQRNTEMNFFIGEIVEKMRIAGIYTLLVKGQGVAQCYERPLWRVAGDIDFFLSDSNYENAKNYLPQLASSVESEGKYRMHTEMIIKSWAVELHGTLRCGLSPAIDRTLDEIQRKTFYDGAVSSWINNGIQVFLLEKNNDVLYVFTHFLGHFYKGGIGLRQVCDWCRLLWTYRDSLNYGLLESQIKTMGLMSEWKSFGAFAVKYLGMPIEAMPLYSSERKWEKKSDKIGAFIIEVGNFGHNRDTTYYGNKSYLIQKCISFGRRIGDLFRHMMVFPLDSLKFFPNIMFNGMISALRGE